MVTQNRVKAPLQGQVVTVDRETGEVISFDPPDDLPAPGEVVHEAHYIIPMDSSFLITPEGDEDEEPVETEFILAPGLEEVANAMIAVHQPFKYLDGHHIVYRWARSALGTKHPTGKTMVPTPDMQWAFQQYGGATVEIVVTLSAKECRRRSYGPAEVEAVLYHELDHIFEDHGDGVDDEGRGRLLLGGHEFEGSSGEVKRYGFWHTGGRRIEEAAAKRIQAAARQLSLLEEDANLDARRRKRDAIFGQGN